jgi:hypothetical protein
MDPEFRGLLTLCLFVLPFAVLFSAFLMWVVCRMAAMADEKLRFKE